MLIFFSHALLDKELANNIKELIEQVSFGLVDVWLSSAVDGLKTGDIFLNEIHNKLEKCDKIITLLTPNSLGRDWLLYETGFVAGKKESQVVPLLFEVSKDELPLPLSAYVTYSGDEEKDLSNLLLQIVAEVAPNPNKKFIQSQTSMFITDTSEIRSNFKNIKTKRLNDIELVKPQFLYKLDASELFHKKLADPEVKKIIILTYTNEVESGSINPYRIKGIKQIDIYKRSILADLIQQQEVNLLRLIKGSKVRYWDKKDKSLDATLQVDKAFSNSKEITINQYFYDGPPVKRAYLFDNKEAIVSYYETSEDPLMDGGSVYKGMVDSKSIYVNRNNPYGEYIIEELVHYIKNLKINSRSWIEESEVINNPWKMVRGIPNPCFGAKVVFLDLDGIIYDSLPFYEKAWRLGFKEVKIDLNNEDVYLKEGRSGRGTVRDIFEKNLKRFPTEKEIDLIIDRKKEVLIGLGEPPIQVGAIKMVENIINSGLEVYVVTGSTRDGVKEKLIKDFPILKRSDYIIDGNDVRYGKPSPEPYLLACEKANVSPCEAIVIENAPLGIRSAVEAGIFCIAVNTGILDDAVLKENGANAIFSDCETLANMWNDVLKILKM